MTNPSMTDLQAERELIFVRHAEAQDEVQALRDHLKLQQSELSTLESAIEPIHQELTQVIQQQEELRIKETSLREQMILKQEQLTQTHQKASEGAQKLGPIFQKAKRFADALAKLDASILEVAQMTGEPILAADEGEGAVYSLSLIHI